MPNGDDHGPTLEETEHPVLDRAMGKIFGDPAYRILRNKMLSRDAKLGEWWRRHQKKERDRIAQEEEDRQLKAARRKALKKLTKEEREALGL